MPVPPNPVRSAFRVQAAGGRPVHVLGNELLIKISSEDTAGAFTVFEGQTEPLTGPPLHRHPNQDEWWHILDGEFRFEVDGQEIYARAGDTVFAQRGSRHTFQNVGSKPGRTLTTVVPGGVDCFFQDLEAVAPRGAVPDPAKMRAVFEKHGQELLGPPLAARPIAAGSPNP